MAFIALGSIVLTVTGAEALYADMGHFGRPPIRRAWFLLVFPALTLNYMGQGSLILRDPRAIENPFFLLMPHWARLPMVFLATVATVIASQAVHLRRVLGHPPGGAARVPAAAGDPPHLAGGGAGLRPGGQLGHLRRGRGARGRLRLLRRHLASAYGIAVTGTLAIDTILFFFVVRVMWHKPLWLVGRRRGRRSCSST